MAYTVRDTKTGGITVPTGERVQFAPNEFDDGQTYFRVLAFVGTPSRDLSFGGPFVDAATGLAPNVYPFSTSIFHRDDLPYAFNAGSSPASLEVVYQVVTGTL